MQKFRNIYRVIFTIFRLLKVYAFKYCDCIYESAYATVSLHLSKDNAEKAMNAHREAKKLEFESRYIPEGEEGFYRSEFGEYERWCVDEMDILP